MCMILLILSKGHWYESDNHRITIQWRHIEHDGISNHWCLDWLLNIHDDVIKWKPFPRYWPFVRGLPRSPVNSPHKGQWRGALMFSLICVWINGWVNNPEAGDLSRYRAHYDVIVMICSGTGQTKLQGFTSLSYVRGIHGWLVDSPPKGPVT